MMTGSSSTKSTSLYQVKMLICLPERIPSIFMNGNPTFFVVLGGSGYRRWADRFPHIRSVVEQHVSM
jgi:hypothetical protein